MKVGQLKKALQGIPDELEIVTDCFEKDGVTISETYRARVEDLGIEDTNRLVPALFPEFTGEKVLCLKYIKRRSF